MSKHPVKGKKRSKAPASAGKRTRGKTLPAAKQNGMVKEGRTVEAIAAEQGVGPVEDFDKLLGDFWPEDETADEFIAAVRRWRHERKE